MKPECGKEWSRKFLRENLTNVFLNSKYKEHLENILFDQEKALLPATQPLVQEKILKQKLKKQLDELNLFINDLFKQKRELEYQIQNGCIKYDKSNFVRQCPANECRGFLSSQWKCGICEQWSCSECYELKGPIRNCEHKCDPNNVETAKILAKDSKPCPKCQSLIFKISGCDQIWCTQCHVAFSWKTGKLEQSIHNPHFYEWQRKNGGGTMLRNPGDVECGRELNANMVSLIHLLSKKHKDLHSTKKMGGSLYTNKTIHSKTDYSPIIVKIADIIRNSIHNLRVELPTFQTDYVFNNQYLRIRYLEKSISEEEFKRIIQRNDKKTKKNTDIAQVLQLANITVTDIIYRIIDNLDKTENGKHSIDTIVKEFEEIIKYCNDILKDISFTYKVVQYGFDETFTFNRIEKKKSFMDESSTDDVMSDEDK
jgi:hypothetical protein